MQQRIQKSRRRQSGALKAAEEPAKAQLPKQLKNGLFITFEGGEGSGKSTQIQKIAEILRAQGFAVLTTREPGGTKGAEALRHILLNARNYHYSPLLEAVLFAAARRDHIEQVIAPALAKGMIVLCDRFIDSTRVYQGLDGKVPKNSLDFLEAAAIAPYRPQLSFFLDLAAQTGMARALKRRSRQEQADRFEKDALNIQEQRRQAFLKIARQEPQRCRVINADRAIAAITADIWAQIADRLGIDRAALAADNAPAAAAVQRETA